MKPIHDLDVLQIEEQLQNLTIQPVSKMKFYARMVKKHKNIEISVDWT